jgi:site-specific DNA-methyltransferase (adenine-specific)
MIDLDGIQLHHGDCREVLVSLPDCSVDSVVTDPPYELGFMGKAWDGSGIAYSVEMWAEVLRVLKPGGHLCAFGGTRTYHRMACAIEDAGFEIRDSLHWVYGSGFPKSLDVSKAIDARQKTGGESPQHRRMLAMGDEYTPHPYAGTENFGSEGWNQKGGFGTMGGKDQTPLHTDAAKQWEGWGTALKPAHEPIVLARRPLISTVAANVLTHGTGALNIDGARVPGSLDGKPNRWAKTDGGSFIAAMSHSDPAMRTEGRWPANVIFDTEAGALLDEQSGVSRAGNGSTRGNGGTKYANGKGFANTLAETGQEIGYGDSGGASRFFTAIEWEPEVDVPFRYIAKPGKRERNAGLDGLPERRKSQLGSDKDSRDGLDPVSARFVSADPVANVHPTVKPLALMRWLVKLITPPGGTVLEPFAGSGTTLMACVLEGFNGIGIELTDEYLPIIEGRVRWAQHQPQTLDL